MIIKTNEFGFGRYSSLCNFHIEGVSETRPYLNNYFCYFLHWSQFKSQLHKEYLSSENIDALEIYGAIKIGFTSRRIDIRLKEIEKRWGVKNQIKLIGFMCYQIKYSAELQENRMKDKWDKYQIKYLTDDNDTYASEWFVATPKIIYDLKQLCNQNAKEWTNPLIDRNLVYNIYSEEWRSIEETKDIRDAMNIVGVNTIRDFANLYAQQILENQ